MCRDVQACLGHDRQEPHGLDRDRLTPGVRAGHDQGLKLKTEVDVDGNYGLRLFGGGNRRGRRLDGFDLGRYFTRRLGDARGAVSPRKKSFEEGVTRARSAQLSDLVEVWWRHAAVEAVTSAGMNQVELPERLQASQGRVGDLADLSG